MGIRSGKKVQKSLDVERKKRQQLVKQIEEVKSRINEIKAKGIPNTEFEIMELRKKIKVLQSSVQNQKKQEDQTTKENFLVRAFEEKCKFDTSVLSEYSQKLAISYDTMKRINNVNISEVRKIIEEFVNTCVKTLSKELNIDISEIDFASLKLKELLTPQILEHAQEILKEQSISIRHSFENSHTLKDADKERIQQIENALEEERRRHITRFSETQSYVIKTVQYFNYITSLSNISQDLKIKFERLNEEIRETGLTIFGEKSIYVEEMRKNEIELSQFRAVRAVLEDYIACLTEEREKRKIVRQSLPVKQQEINSLRQKRIQKYDKVETLIQETNTLVNILPQKQEQVHMFLQDRIPPITEPFANVLETFGNIVETEYNTVSKIPLDYIIHTDYGEKRLLRKDLSIFAREELGGKLKKILDILEFPEHKAIDHVLTHATDMKQELTVLENERENLKELIEHMRAVEQGVDSSAIQQVIEENHELENAQNEHWTGLIDRTKMEIENFKEEAENVHNLSEVLLHNPVIQKIDWNSLLNN